MKSLLPVIKILLLVFSVTLLNACGTDDDNGGDSSVTISWTPPTEYEDNTPLTVSEIASYRIYYGTNKYILDNYIEVDASINMANYTLNYDSNKVNNNTTYYVAMTTVTTTGIESSLSDITSFYSN